MISEHTGISVYYLNKQIKLGVLKHVIWSDQWEVDLSTTNTSQENMWKVCSFLRDWAEDEFGLIILEPDNLVHPEPEFQYGFHNINRLFVVSYNKF